MEVPKCPMHTDVLSITPSVRCPRAKAWFTHITTTPNCFDKMWSSSGDVWISSPQLFTDGMEPHRVRWTRFRLNAPFWRLNVSKTLKKHSGHGSCQFNSAIPSSINENGGHKFSIELNWEWVSSMFQPSFNLRGTAVAFSLVVIVGLTVIFCIDFWKAILYTCKWFW